MVEKRGVGLSQRADGRLSRARGEAGGEFGSDFALLMVETSKESLSRRDWRCGETIRSLVVYRQEERSRSQVESGVRDQVERRCC